VIFLRAGVLGFLGAVLAALAAFPAAAVNDAALLAAKPPKLLSAYELFADGAAQTPAEGVIPYDVSTPLFSDYAAKKRFVYVPAGASATYEPESVFDFPVGSALVKTFWYPGLEVEDGRPADFDLIETRLLIRKEAGWVAYPYVWRADGSDAELKLAGRKLDITFLAPGGDETLKARYVVPNVNQCKGCHVADGAFRPIGPKARNLNHDYDYASGPENQILHWSEAGILKGAPEEGEPGFPVMVRWDDPQAPLEARARAYLDVNCGHCHNPQGPASTSGLNLDWTEKDPAKWGVHKRPVAAGRGSGGLDFAIEPGTPDASILVYRMESTDPGVMMPELGRSLTHDEGVALVRAWIAGMQ